MIPRSALLHLGRPTAPCKKVFLMLNCASSDEAIMYSTAVISVAAMATRGTTVA
jgi:hypothetical protein